jgi:hypothetical protein
VRVKDVEAAAPVHQHLGEARIADDRVDDQRVLARVRDAVRVILVAEGNGVLRLVEEGGRSLLRGEDLVPLSLALAVGLAELAGEFACDNFRKRHKAGLRVERHGEAALERSRAVSSADPSVEHEKVSPRLKATVGLK